MLISSIIHLQSIGGLSMKHFDGRVILGDEECWGSFIEILLFTYLCHRGIVNWLQLTVRSMAGLSFDDEKFVFSMHGGDKDEELP